LDRLKATQLLRHAVHWALLGGLAASGLLLAVGLVVALVGKSPRPEGPPPSIAALLRGAARGDGTDLMELGLLVLIATPVLRVAVLAAGWAREGEIRFATVAGAVLALLALSFVLGVG
jgi:hypothetical protein